MRTRNTKRVTMEISAEQFEEAMQKYAAAEECEANIYTALDICMNKLIAQYENELHVLSLNKQSAFEIVQRYCINNKEALFGKRRSIGTKDGIAGFRLGTPQLRTIKGNDWNNVLMELKRELPEYVRITEEPAKDMLLADRSKEKVASLLLHIGIQVVQDELFYIETKKAA